MTHPTVLLAEHITGARGAIILLVSPGTCHVPGTDNTAQMRPNPGAPALEEGSNPRCTRLHSLSPTCWAVLWVPSAILEPSALQSLSSRHTLATAPCSLPQRPPSKSATEALEV